MDIYKEISLVLGVRVTKETFDFKLKRVAASGGFTAKHQEQLILILVKRLGELEEKPREESVVDVEGTISLMQEKMAELEEKLRLMKVDIEKKVPAKAPEAPPAKKVEPKKKAKKEVKKKEPAVQSNKVASAKKAKESKSKKSDDKKTDK